jgi:hypothetical protein
MTDLEREMLEALKALVWQHDNVGHLCGMALQDARAAIARAEPHTAQPSPDMAWDGSPIIKQTIQGQKWQGG